MSKSQNFNQEAEQFSERMEIAYTKYQIKYMFKIMQHIIHFYYFDKQAVDLILSKVKVLYEELRDWFEDEDKNKLRQIDGYVWERLDESIWIK